ncbi:MAG: T9SS type A sorting domain-containing protein [Bacteroidota bacterium]
MELSQNGSNITGSSYISLANSNSYAHTNLFGTLTDSVFHFNQTTIISEIPPSGGGWCILFGDLVYDSIENTLQGPWDSNTNGCTVLGTIKLWNLSLLSDTVFCQGEEIRLEVGGNNVTWYNDQNLGFPVAVGNTYIPTISTTTTYYLTQTHSGVESPSYPITIHISPGPSVDLGPDVDLLPGEQTILNATGSGLTYLWSTGQTDPAIIVEEAGTYSVIVTDSLGCTASDTLVVKSLVSTEELFNYDLQVYPNPTTNQLHIKSSQTKIQSLHLSNLFGQPIPAKVDLKPTEATLISNYSGLAFLKIQTKKGWIMRKIVFE